MAVPCLYGREPGTSVLSVQRRLGTLEPLGTEESREYPYSRSGESLGVNGYVYTTRSDLCRYLYPKLM